MGGWSPRTENGFVASMSEQEAVQAEAAGETGRALAAEFLEGLPGGHETPADGQSGSEQGSGTPKAPKSPPRLEGKVVVPYGGVDREVDIAELVEAHQKSAETAAQRAALSELVEQGGIGLRIARFLDSVPEEHRPAAMARLEAALAGQEPQARSRQPQGANLAEQFLGEDLDPQQQDNPGVMQVLQHLAQGMSMLLNERTERIESDNKSSLSNRIDELMDAYPATRSLKSMKGGKIAIDLAKQQIVASATANPKTDLDRLVAQAAVQLNQMVTGLSREVVEERGGNTDFRVLEDRLGKPKPEQLTGDQLLNGGLYRQLTKGRFAR